MDTVVKAVVEAIHASPTQAVLCLSGGASQVIEFQQHFASLQNAELKDTARATKDNLSLGSNSFSVTSNCHETKGACVGFVEILKALGWLLSVPRASNTILEVTVPYSRVSMLQFLGKAPLKFTSRETAEDIALAAYNRALRLSVPGVPVAGIGFTGALASATPKRGDHRCYVAARTQTGLWECNLTLSKGKRDRFDEDDVTSRILIKTLGDVCGVSLELPLGLDDTLEKLYVSNKNFTEDEQLEQLIEGKTSMISYAQSQGLVSGGRKVVLSGSFNPLHEGHVKLVEVACSMCEGSIPCFEMSAVNADKPPVSLVDIKKRVKQFRDRGKTLVLTNQPYFYKKAELLPDSTFVVGVDTAIRLINVVSQPAKDKPKYYGESRERMLEVLLGIKHLGCDFLVAGRKVGEKFQVLADLNVPEPVKELFLEIPDDAFRVDISSTELRETTGQSSL